MCGPGRAPLEGNSLECQDRLALSKNKIGNSMKRTVKKWGGTLALSLSLLGTGLCYGQDVSRKIIKKVAAQYPSVLRQRGIGGVVKLRVLVTASGTVKDTQVSGD